MNLCIENSCCVNSLECVDGDFVSSLITTLIGTFVGFFLAMLAERQIESKRQKQKAAEENKKILNHLRYLQTILISLSKVVPKQTDKYIEYIEAIKANPLELHASEILATYDFFRLRNADNVEVQEAYFLFVKGGENNYEDYKTLFDNGDFLLRTFESFEEQVNRATGFKFKRQSEIRDLLEEITLKLGMRAEIIKNELKEKGVNPPEEYTFIINLSDEYFKIIQTAINFNDARNKFINPLFSKCRDMIKDKLLMEEIFRLTRRAHGLLIETEGNAIEHADEILALKPNIEDAYNNLNEQLQRITESLKNNAS